MELINIYNALLEEYGSQLWWPTTSEGEIKPQYTGGPKSDKQRLEICIGAILTQNTSWKNVEKAIVNLNKENLIDLEKLKKIEIKKMEELIRPSGFFKQKAERLKIFAEFLSNKKFFELTREELLKVKGIGPETADSILLYACGKPEFVVDAYTKRIFGRVGSIKTEKYDEIKNFFQSNLHQDPKLYQEFHALIVEHAKRFCKKEPECKLCPLRNQCQYFRKLPAT